MNPRRLCPFRPPQLLSNKASEACSSMAPKGPKAKTVVFDQPDFEGEEGEGAQQRPPKGQWRWSTTGVEQKLQQAKAQKVPVTKDQEKAIAWSRFRVILYHPDCSSVIFEKSGHLHRRSVDSSKRLICNLRRSFVLSQTIRRVCARAVQNAQGLRREIRLRKGGSRSMFETI